MTDPKVPSGGSTSDDDIDALLESWGAESSSSTASVKSTAPPPRPSTPMYSPPRPMVPPPPRPMVPPPPRPLSNPSSLPSLFDDEPLDVPTRVADMDEIKRAASESAGERGTGAGFGDLFTAGVQKPTAPPPQMEDSLGDLPELLSDDGLAPAPASATESFSDLALEDEEIAASKAKQEHPGSSPLPASQARSEERSAAPASVPLSASALAVSEQEPRSDELLDLEALAVQVESLPPSPLKPLVPPPPSSPRPPLPPRPRVPAPPPSPSVIASPPRPAGDATRLAQRSPAAPAIVPPPPPPAIAASPAVPSAEEAVLALDAVPTQESEDQAHSLDAWRATEAAVPSAPDSPEKSKQIEAVEARVAPEAPTEDDGEGPALESTDDEGPALDEGPEFEEDEESDETIDLEVGGEEEIAVERRPDDRGALLAATVTSRKRETEPSDHLFALVGRDEAEARATLLEREAENAPTPERAAEMLEIAGTLVEGVLGDRERARGLYERARELDPASPFPLRSLRRLAIEDGDIERAAALCDAELSLPISRDEREDLESFAAEVAARQGSAHAEERWDAIAKSGGVRGALAQLFASASRHDHGAMGEALGALGAATTGSLAAAANLARARVAEGAAEADTALAAVQAAVQRDPNDAGSWLAMARIGIGRESAQTFREALAGIARSAPESAAGYAAAALERATAGVMSDPVTPLAVPMAGPAGWLVAHALRDAGLDEGPQVVASLAAASDVQRAAWEALLPDAGKDAQTEVARLLALRRAVSAGDAGAVASAAAVLVGDEGPVLRAALLARKGGVEATEVASLEEAGAARAHMASVLLAAVEGADAVDARERSSSGGAFERLAKLERTSRGEEGAERIRAGYEDLAADEVPQALRTLAARQAARLADDLSAMARALQREAAEARDPQRAAALRFVAASVLAGLASEGGASEAIEAARAMPGDAAAAELVALFGLRGEASVAESAEALAASAGDASTLVARMAAVRAALRRAAVDPEGAADALYKVWTLHRDDGPLAALTLRALPEGDAERRAAVLRDMAERAEGQSPGAAMALWTLLAHALTDANKLLDAARALARARTFALNDPALLAWEEKLWLGAGMFAEVAERSFDALKAAETDEARIAAYEKLAEIDSIFRKDVASAVLTYQAILELAPGHMASLRTLERYFLEQGRQDELLGIYERLVRHVGDPEDAVAIAHAAARVAIKQAEGDHAAGAPYWQAAFERGMADMRLLQDLEMEARRDGDARRFASVMERGEQLAPDARERATFALRAGEALMALGEPAAAVEAFERAIAAHPVHPVALTWLATARESAGDASGAAEAFEALARASQVPAQAARAYLQAAVHWQDKVGDNDRALAALREVIERDPGNAEAFARSMRVLKDKGDRASEIELIEARLQAEIDPSEALPLRVRAAELCEDLGDPARARVHLREALSLSPENQPVLRALARLSRDAADWPSAADAMIRLARLTTESAERAELMFGLGEIYDQHLPDLKRAEAAYRRVLQLLPGDTRTLARLADLYARTGDAVQEAEVLRALVQGTPPGASRRALQIRLAAVLSEKLNELKKAEETLEAARRDAPTDMDVLRAFARLYVRQEAPAALAVLLDRAAAEVRRTLDADPTSATQMELLADILKLRGRVDGARVIGAVAHGLGVASEKLAPLSREGVVPGAGGSALAQEPLELLAPPAITVAHRELLRLAGDVLERLVPFEPGAARAEKLGARPHPMRAEVEKWAKVFGLESVEIYLGPATPLVVSPLGRHPPAVMLPVDLRDSPAARFAVVRAMVLVALSLPLVVRLPPHEVTLVLSALLRQFEPMFVADGVDIARLDELTRRITRTLPRTRHGEMMPHAFEVIGSKATDGDAIATAAIELGNRIALLASGDVAGAIAALTPAGQTPRAAISTPALGRLVRVAISDRFLEARHVAGADRRASSG